MTQKPTAIVIGAGIGGIATAARLARNETARQPPQKITLGSVGRNPIRHDRFAPLLQTLQELHQATANL